MPPPGLSEALDQLFTTDGHFTRLYQLLCREIHPGQYKDFMRQEERAHGVEHYAASVMWGMLQTAEYARALFRYEEISDDKVEELVASRLARQERLGSGSPPRVWAIIDEAVLRRPVGGPEAMRDQLARLLPMVDTPNSKIQVLPFTHGGHALMAGSMTLLKLPDSETAAWQEVHGNGFLIEDREQVARLQGNYDALRAYALSPQDSAAVIQQSMEEYKR